jgi:hypothetical protein
MIPARPLRVPMKSLPRCFSAALLALVLAPLSGSRPASFPFFLDFTVIESEGVARAAEPVRLLIPLDSRASGLGSARLLNQSTQRDEPVEAAVTADSRTAEILFFSTQAANSRIDYRLYYGGDDGAAGPRELVRVTGNDLAWKVETRHMTINLDKNPGTGRSGQINTILLKEPPVLLTRARPTSTLHLSPNAAVGGGWNGVNRWDPPAKWSCRRGPLAAFIEREGQMPAVPGLYVKVVYEFFAETPAITVSESVEARQEAQVSLLRMNEISFANGPENPFTHIAWEEASGGIFIQKKEKEKALPFDCRWMAFLDEREKFGFASLVERFSASNAAGQSGLLLNAEAHFGGDPHYFYRTLINRGKEGPLVSIPSGTRYSTRYWLYCFWAAPATAGETLSRLCRAVQHPLRVQIKDTAMGHR